MSTIIGLVAAAVIFVASFALHIVGGATDQGWLFGLAVGLIYVSASAFGVIAWIIAGARRADRLTLALGSVIGVVLTASALWAADGRSVAWWHPPVAIALVAATSGAMYLAWTALRRSATGTGSRQARAEG